MKWVPDTTNRFKWRPYYEREELDIECERIICGFLRQKNGSVGFPVSNDDLAIMVESDTSDLDLYADLSSEGRDVEGMTEFFPGRKPVVRISRELSLDPSKNSQFRTTLAHEYGHARFHAFLWDEKMVQAAGESILNKIPAQRRRYAQLRKFISSEMSGRRVLYSSTTKALCGAFKCRKDDMLEASFSDWMEWQAGYASLALLMPLSHLKRMLGFHNPENAGLDILSCDLAASDDLIHLLSTTFDVSPDATRIRLRRLGLSLGMPLTPPPDLPRRL